MYVDLSLCHVEFWWIGYITCYYSILLDTYYVELANAVICMQFLQVNIQYCTTQRSTAGNGSIQACVRCYLRYLEQCTSVSCWQTSLFLFCCESSCCLHSPTFYRSVLLHSFLLQQLPGTLNSTLCSTFNDPHCLWCTVTKHVVLSYSTNTAGNHMFSVICEKYLQWGIYGAILYMSLQRFLRFDLWV